MTLPQGFAQVSQSWLARYAGPTPGDDVGNAIAVDSAGNVYVAGRASSSSFGIGDFMVIKYSPSGDSAWLRTYDGSGNGEDEALAVAVDRSGNVYATGFSTDSSSGKDIVTIKYNSEGVMQWIRRYDGTARFEDIGTALALDSSANVYVTGQSFSTTTFSDFLTIKYNTSGVVQWVRRDSCSGLGQDYAFAIALDASASRVFVTGTSIGNGTGFDYYTSCYWAANGDSVWSLRFNGPATADDEARSIAVDRFGNAFVTGFVNNGPTTSSDYATIKYDPIGAQQWVRFYNGSGDEDDAARAVAVDDAGNVYVTGWSLGDTSNTDFVTIKYTSNGVEQWVQRYNGQGDANDAAVAIATDRFANVYVGGSGGDLFVRRFATAKYNTDGVQQWVVLSDSSGRSRALRVDSDGSVYVTGNSEGLNPDCVTIKYSQTTHVREDDDRMATEFVLCQNYPNPFNPATRIPFQVRGLGVPAGQAGFVSLKVYDVLGSEVATLVNEEKSPGEHIVAWDAEGVASGVYLYRLSADGATQTRRMILVR